MERTQSTCLSAVQQYLTHFLKSEISRTADNKLYEKMAKYGGFVTEVGTGVTDSGYREVTKAEIALFIVLKISVFISIQVLSKISYPHDWYITLR